MDKKGFLGPIGDDLPSIIPLTFALVMFFSTFTFAFNSFQSRNSYFNDSLSIVSIATSLKQDSYLSGLPRFKELCKTVNVPRLKFKAGLVPLADYAGINFLDPDNPIDKSVYEIKEEACDENPSLCYLEPEDVSRIFRCTNLRGTEEEIEAEPKSGNKNILLRVYPIALETHEKETVSGFAVKPMLLVIVTWRD